MEVILKQDVDKIGKAGSVVGVKDGFARNFLIPKKLAVLVTKASIKRLQEEKDLRVARLEKIKKEAEELKSKLSQVSLTIAVLTQEDESFYGSIASAEISRALKDEGFDIDKTFIELSDPIKALGIYEVPINLHPEVSVAVKVWIVKK